MKRTTVKRPDEVDVRLRLEAKRRRMTISELTREAIETHLARGGSGGCSRPASAAADAEIRLLGDLATGAFATVAVEEDDWLRIAELVARYRDLPLGTVDASIVAAAERLGVATIATLDRRHFDIVRPVHRTAFELLPLRDL
ncbi:MAG: PIN domain-containing protein [Actinobacteria bacterium]|nr:MAG: PIN domain-containing protein [Actinomycetota bacterium]